MIEVKGIIADKGRMRDCGKVDENQSFIFPFLNSVELVIAMRVLRAWPASANRKLSICGVNSRLSGTFCAKLTIQ